MATPVTEQLKALYKQEWQREPNRSANLSLLKAIAFFTGAIVVTRTWGELLTQ